MEQEKSFGKIRTYGATQKRSLACFFPFIRTLRNKNNMECSISIVLFFVVELHDTRSDNRFKPFIELMAYNWIREQDDSLKWRIAVLNYSLQIENKSVNKYESQACHEDTDRITFTTTAKICIRERKCPRDRSG